MKVENVLLSVIPDASNIRGSFEDHPSWLEFVESVRQSGIMIPVLLLPNKQPLDGFRRIAAARKLKLESIPAIITDRMLSDTEIRLAQLTSSIHRADLTGFEKWNACTEILCANTSWGQQHLAQHLGLSEASVTKLLSPSKLSAEWQDALKAGKVTISDCYRASTTPEGQRAGLLALKLSGATGEQMEKAARKPKPHTTVTVKLSRVKLPLQDGAVVAVSAPGEVDTQGLLDLLDAAREAVKKADREKIDVRTLTQVLADKARKA